MSDETALPRIGSSVELHEVGGRTSLARVHEIGDETVTVVLPFDTAITAASDPKWAFDLTWSVPGGVAVLPVTVTERTGAAQIQLWKLTGVGPARTQQRRHEPRVPVGEDVTITVFPELGPRALPATENDPRPLSGRIMDISASAAQCVVTSGADDVVLHTGMVATCDFTLSGAPIVLRGSLLDVWTAAGNDQIRVVVQFDSGQPALTRVVDYIGSSAAADTD